MVKKFVRKGKVDSPVIPAFPAGDMPTPDVIDLESEVNIPQPPPRYNIPNADVSGAKINIPEFSDEESSKPSNLEDVKSKVSSVISKGAEFMKKENVSSAKDIINDKTVIVEPTYKLEQTPTPATVVSTTPQAPGFVDKLGKRFTNRLEEIKEEIATGKTVKKTDANGVVKPAIIDDNLAYAGGSKWSNKNIEEESEKIDKLEAAKNKKIEDLKLEKETLEESRNQILVKISNNNDAINEIRKKDKETRTEKENQQLYKLVTENDGYTNTMNRKQYRVDEIDETIKILNRDTSIEKARETNFERRALYEKAISIAKQSKQKEGGWRKDMQSFSENASSLLGKPTINPADGIADYGGLGSRRVSQGFDNLIGKASVNRNANEWVKTRAGDRGLVESLVKVNQNNMITPFGVPGTVAGGNTSRQFSYNIPLNRIGVGDVTAKPGYRINIEDIRRKKSVVSKPNVVRKKTKVSKANIASVGGNLTMNIPKLQNPISVNIGKQDKINIGSTIKHVDTPKVGVSNVSVNIGSAIKHMDSPRLSNNSIKINIPQLKVDANKSTRDTPTKIDTSGITPFTFKNIEVNLNNVSKSMKKKMKVKV